MTTPYSQRPSLFAKAKLFLHSASEIVKSGGAIADDQTIEKRAQTCMSCPHLDQTNTCHKCGCPMAHKVIYSAVQCADYPPRW